MKQTEDAEDIILQFLLLEFEKRNSKNFYFKARRLSRNLSLSTRKISRVLTTLAVEGILLKEKRRLWKTNFIEE